MDELVVGLANILSKLFMRYPITVNNLDGVDRILPKFSSLHEASAVTKSTPQKTSVVDLVDFLSTEIAELCISNNNLRK